MNLLSSKKLLLAIVVIFSETICFAQQNIASFINGDALPDAPELATRGHFKVGVQTLDLVHLQQIDILKSKNGSTPLYDRPLKVEIWYPAISGKKQTELVTYQSTLGLINDTARPLIPYALTGRAMRNAAPDLSKGKFPLIIVSHGYPGDRYLLTYLTENLASKGYVVVAIDHTESTYGDRAAFQSTLLNRPQDILFVLNQMADLSKPTSTSFLAGLADANNTALIGYSMGGYGVLNAAGAGYSKKLDTVFAQMTGGSKAINMRSTGDAEFNESQDPRIKAVVAFAPWGMKFGVWDSTGLKGLKTPTFFIAGSLDDVSGYEDGIKAIYKGTTNANRYLLTYQNARHNIAPNPPPAETLKAGVAFNEYYHFAEPAWNERRINNINQHFVTAFIGIHLKQQEYGKFLTLPMQCNEKTWTGFKPRTSVGLELSHALPQ